MYLIHTCDITFIEPKRGEWDFSKANFYRAFYQSTRSMVILGGPPSWAKDLYSTNTTEFLNAYSSYCERAIEIVGTSEILGFQLWNEMNHVPSSFVNRDTKTVREIFRRAGAAARQARRDAPTFINVMADDPFRVMGMVPWEEALDTWLDETTSSFIDGIGIDHYPGTWTIDPSFQDWSPLENLLSRVNDPTDALFGKQPAILESKRTHAIFSSISSQSYHI